LAIREVRSKDTLILRYVLGEFISWYPWHVYIVLLEADIQLASCGLDAAMLNSSQVNPKDLKCYLNFAATVQEEHVLLLSKLEK
jgi:hypothetical protein